MNKFCGVLESDCLESAKANALHKLYSRTTTENTNKLTHCFYSCFKDNFIKWVHILYGKKHLKSIDLIADISFTEGVLKLKEAVEQQKLYEGAATAKTVLYNFCKYKLLEQIQTETRRNKKEKILFIETIKNQAEQAFDDNNEIQLLLLEQTLSNMNEEEKKVIEWRHLEQKSNKEIANLLGITVESATNKIYRCMENLRTLLKSKI